MLVLADVPGCVPDYSAQRQLRLAALNWDWAQRAYYRTCVGEFSGAFLELRAADTLR